MFKSLVKNSSIYYLSGILTKGISFFLLPLYTSLLTTEDYGVLELMSIVSTLAIIIFTFQLNQGVARYYNELINQKQIQIYTSTIVFFSFFSFLVLFLFFFIFNSTIGSYLNLLPKTVTIVGASIALNGLFYMSQNQLTWKILPLKEMIGSLIYNIITIGLTVIFLVIFNKGIEGIFIAQCIGAVSGIVSAYYFTKKDFGFYFSISVLKKIFKFSLPLIPGALSIFIYMFTDRVCIKEMLGLNELGVFSVGNKIATILTFTSLGFSTALSPLVYKHYKEIDTPKKIAFLFRIFSAFSFIAMSFLAFFSKEIILLMTTGEYENAAIIIPFLLFAVYLNSLTFFFPGLSISKKGLKISLIAISAGLINLIFNVIFIPYYGILAASIVTCLSFGINFILLYLYSQKEYNINVSLLPVFTFTSLYFILIFISIKFDMIGLKVFFFATCIILSRFLVKKEDVDIVKNKIKSFSFFKFL